ncbi:MazG-like family protein [Streptomyces qinzhouensis]|uniref:MazG-like family protein n=1 Tax=Streptomyces qinzhouensis TaxID=2599401 RepID=UPI001FE273F0|nr:MazG-like family protein [Streptomyces qinzhouensis]
MDDATIWPTVDRLRIWLDAACDRPAEQELLLRVLKLAEEVGETAQAVIGASGQNPRKGHSHTWRDVESELCDVVLTAMVALRTLTPDAERIFAEHVRKVAERSLSPAPGTSPAPTPTPAATLDTPPAPEPAATLGTSPEPEPEPEPGPAVSG